MGIIYKVPGNLKGPKGTTYDWKGADDGDDIPHGWRATLAEAVDAHLAPEDKPKRKRRTKAEIEADKEKSDE